MSHYISKIIATIAITLFLAACSSKPTHLELVIESSHNLNPDVNKVPSPLMITFYELESAESFLKFDYWTILENSGKNLGPDLISQSKNIIIPNQGQTYKIVFNEKAKFLGILGQFRDIKNSEKWKEVINLRADEYNHYEIRLNDNKIEKAE